MNADDQTDYAIEALLSYGDEEIMPELRDTLNAKRAVEQNQSRIIGAIKKQCAVSHSEAVQAFVNALRIRRAERTF